MYPFYLGIDLHLKRTYAVLMDHTGEVIDERWIRNPDLQAYLQGQVPRETYAVLEATRNWAFLYDLLEEHVERVELAHPRELKAIASAAVKTDQMDAKVLANLVRLNFLPTSYAAPKEIRATVPTSPRLAGRATYPGQETHSRRTRQLQSRVSLQGPVWCEWA